MRLHKLAILATLATVSFAQTLNLTALTQAFDDVGASSFAGLLANLSSTAEGQTALQMILSGNKNLTIFAPNNEALSQIPSDLAQDSALLLDVVEYHVLNGSFSSSNSNPPQLISSTNHTIGRSLMNNANRSNLEGGAGQVLGWTKNDNGNITFINQAANISVVNSTRINGTGFEVFVITGVLAIPPSFLNVISSINNTASLAGLLNGTMIQSANGTNDTLGNVIGSQKGITVFVPTDSAFAPLTSSLPALEGNQTAFITVLQNHIINGTSVYSTEISNGTTIISAAGEQLKFSTNSSGTYVTSGSTSAKIVQTDVFTENGVIHLIDNVFLNTNSNPAAASSAYESATSAAASMTETGPISATSTAPDGSSSTSNGQGNGAASLPIPAHYYTMSLAAVVSFVVLGAYIV